MYNVTSPDSARQMVTRAGTNDRARSGTPADTNPERFPSFYTATAQIIPDLLPLDTTTRYVRITYIRAAVTVYIYIASLLKNDNH